MLRGIVAEFESPEGLERAYASLEVDGYTRIEAWTPYPLKSILERVRRSPLPWVMLVAALVGGGLGYLVQWWCNGIDFPIDVGSRPLQSAPAFIPITFESAVLASSLAGFFALLWACGLPRLSHPLDEVDGFDRASVDRFWLGVDADDPRFDGRLTARLVALGALRCARLGGEP